MSDLIYDILSALQIFSIELGAQDPLARISCENLNVEIQRIYLDIKKILSEKVKICETTADDNAKKEKAAEQVKQEKEAKAEAEKNAAAQKTAKEKMAKGEKLTVKYFIHTDTTLTCYSISITHLCKSSDSSLHKVMGI